MRSLMRRASVVAGAAVMVLGPVAGMAAAAPAASAAPATCLVLGSGFRPFTSLQAAVDAAHAGGSLVVLGTCGARTVISKNLTVTGLPGATLNAGGGPGLLIAVGARVTLNTLIITNGETGFGGGIYNNGTLTLNGSTVTGNSAFTFGGGIFNDGTMTLNLSTVTDNTSVRTWGGGIANYGTITLNDSRITGNNAGSVGGGILNRGTVALKYGSRITGNTASGGGGIYNDRTVTGATATNITGNAPDNCEPPGSVPGCVG